MNDGAKEFEETRQTIEFAEWRTEVENDQLTLVAIRYGGWAKTDLVQEGISLELAVGQGDTDGDLEATFISLEKRAGVRFAFENVSAFRVLDEHGLVDLWLASDDRPRPANTTFKVKGHKWQRESELSWFMADCEYSFMIATSLDCLEVVAKREPRVTMLPAVVRRTTG